MKPRKTVFRLNRADISGVLNRYISNIGIIPAVMMAQVLYEEALPDGRQRRGHRPEEDGGCDGYRDPHR